MAMSHVDQNWRARLTHDISWWFIVKLGLLTLLWAFFFSGSHRCLVDGRATAGRLALGVPQTMVRGPAKSQGGDRCD
jgi:hypothetical protein